MDEMPSALFRKTYASLTEPTVVTVNRHPIGQWIPAAYGLTVTADDVGEPEATITRLPDRTIAFNSRQFTPVPKKGR